MFAKKKMKIFLHTTLTVLLAIFFMYKGIDKLPIKLKDISKEEIVSTIIDNNSYEAPVGYKITMNTMRQSGFLRMIAIFALTLLSRNILVVLGLVQRFQLTTY